MPEMRTPHRLKTIASWTCVPWLCLILLVLASSGAGGGARAAPAAAASGARGLEVAIATGAVRGAFDDGVRAFRNIPFAAPPLGDLRWRPPQPPAHWSGVRDATQFGPACPQPARPDGGGAGAGAPIRQSEDCLSLNVWAPEGARHLPVMVWIHGGAHRIGSASFPVYDGGALARQGVVMVSINYRLGLLGYFAHPALTAEAAPDAPLGNYGFLDQIAALAWVKRNIAAFGGDPGNVTLFGESAGGASALFLLASPRARGLFAKAIVESGGGLQNPPDLAAQEQSGLAEMARIGLAKDASVQDLRAVSADKLLDASGPLQGLGFGPFIDGRAITEPPWRAFRDGRAAHVPLIIGANSNEASVLMTLGVAPGAVASFAGDQLPAMRAAYAAPPLAEDEFTRQALGDATFVAPARWIAAQASTYAPSYVYFFSYVAKLRRGRAPGAAHGSEVPYVFQTWDKIPAAAPFVTPEDRSYAAMMSACWTSFAKAGAPSCPPAPAWPAYAPATDAWMSFEAEAKIAPHLRQAPLDVVTQKLLAQRR
jgi:para-nitrobenzyl esterase